MNNTIEVHLFQIWYSQYYVFIYSHNKLRIAGCCNCTASHSRASSEGFISKRRDCRGTSQALRGVVFYLAGVTCWMTHWQNDAVVSDFSVTVLAVVHASCLEGVFIIRSQVRAIIWQTKICTFLQEKRNVLNLFSACIRLSSKLKGDWKRWSVVSDLTFNYCWSNRLQILRNRYWSWTWKRH